MAERLIQIVVPSGKADLLREVIDRVEGVNAWHDASDAVRMIAVQVPADRVDSVLDPIQSALGSVEGFHAVVLPVEAALPRPPEPDEAAQANGEAATAQPEQPSSHISREELYADLSEHAQITPVFVAMVILSTLVAAAGLSRDNPAIVIGAMVMAPLLGPNMALSLATTLGDGKLATRALRSNAFGFLLAAAVAVACGFLFDINADAREIASRTLVGPGDLLVALAAGVAGALAFTTGVPSSLVGVMVAVALLPPLVVCSMLLAEVRMGEALGALLLLMCNVISINLAGVATFLIQGVSPRTWWDTERSKRMTRRALTVWIALLVVVAVLILLSNLSQAS
jgi:uncharacterized hydrophobic protein (TIGR00341 family)